ncbi:DUF6233 domain-containing protein [Streptomyces paradoxus]
MVRTYLGSDSRATAATPRQTRAQAIEALGHQVPACSKCRPDTALGIEV